MRERTITLKMPWIRESLAITLVIAVAIGANVISASHFPAEEKVSEIRSKTDISPISIEHMKKHFLNLNELRNSQQLSDITLIVGERKIAAHKIVLSISSAYFSAMFTSDMVESKAATVELHDLNEDAVGLIIDFVYTAKLPLIDNSNVQVLLSAASLLQVEEIQRSCCDHLKQQLDASNCLDIREEAEKYSCHDLSAAARNFALDEFEEVIKNDEFLQLRTDRLIEIISDDTLNVISEVHVYEAVMRWIKYKNSPDGEDRTVHLADVLEHVRFSQMRPDYIVEVSENPLIKSSERCRESIEEAKNFFLSYVFHILRGESPGVPDKFCSQRYRPRIRRNSGEKLYVVGGLSGLDPNDIEARLERYDPKTNSWTILNNTFQPSIDAGVGVLNGVLYAIGCYYDRSYLSSIESYHIDTDEWKSGVVAPLSSVRCSMAVATLDGYLYAIGGDDATRHSLNLVKKYDPIGNKWSACSPLASARSGAGVATLDGYIYVVGGRLEGNFFLDTVERYDSNLDRWRSLAPMMVARGDFACAAFGGYIYAVGGYGNARDYLASVERYNPSKDMWELIPSMAEPRNYLMAAFVDGLLYAVGGFNGTNILNAVEVYDPVQGVWSSRAPMLDVRARFGVAVSK